MTGENGLLDFTHCHYVFLNETIFDLVIFADPITPRSQQNPVHQEPTIQDHSRGDVRYIWKIRTNTSDQNVSTHTYRHFQ